MCPEAVGCQLAGSLWGTSVGGAGVRQEASQNTVFVVSEGCRAAVSYLLEGGGAFCCS